MARGGYRIGGGRPKGSLDKKPRKRRFDAKKPEKPKRSKSKKQPIEQKPEIRPETDLQDRIKKLLESGTNAKAKIFRDLVNKLATSQSLTSAETKTMVMLEKELMATVEQTPDMPLDILDAIEQMTPLEYMLKIINDPKAEAERRDKLAIAAAPFMHDRKGEGGGKKQDKEDRAKTAGKGRFSPGQAPIRMIK